MKVEGISDQEIVIANIGKICKIRRDAIGYRRKLADTLDRRAWTQGGRSWQTLALKEKA